MATNPEFPDGPEMGRRKGDRRHEQAPFDGPDRRESERRTGADRRRSERRSGLDRRSGQE
ncbi:MAG: hypothetical protein V2I39_03460 [Erythrobacter sp.]|jgi:hypothetical protein|nr:hypothetical protein [Erythrobacter sp.]